VRVNEKKQCTCIGDAKSKVQRYGCANIAFNVPAQAGSCTMQALRSQDTGGVGNKDGEVHNFRYA